MPGPDEIPSGDNFADWVRSRRIAVMLTQEELAQRAGLSVRTVRNLEAGRKGTPRLPTRRLIIAALTGPTLLRQDQGRGRPGWLPPTPAKDAPADKARGLIRRAG